MSGDYYQHITRIMSLLLAFYFLNFSVDTPASLHQDQNNIPKFSEKETLIEIILDMDLEVSHANPFNGDDCDKDAKKKPIQDFTDYLYHPILSTAFNKTSLFDLRFLKFSRSGYRNFAPEILTPPPRS